MNYEIFVVDGKQYRFHDTLLAIYGEPVDEKGNPVDGEWITMPKNGFCRLLIEMLESLRGSCRRRWLYFCVVGAVVGAIVLSMSSVAFIEAVTNGAAIRNFAYFGFFALVGLIDFVVCGGSLLYEIRNPRQRAKEEELEE
jgi:hypothetical protein